MMDAEKTYDVAISFTETDKAVAEALSLALENVGLSVFYYPENRADTWGGNLESKLTEIYQKQAKYALIIFSEAYKNKLFEKDSNGHISYPKIELRAIKKRKNENQDQLYLLPIRIGTDIPLEEFDNEFEGLTFIDWSINSRSIASEVKKLLGKELRELDESAEEGNVLYSTGEKKVVIVDTDISDYYEIDISNPSQSLSVTENDIRGIRISQEFNFSRPKERRFLCANCKKVLDGSKLGKIRCSECGMESIVEDPEALQARQFETLTPEEEQEYRKVLAHIQNKIKDKNYDKAYDYCLKAESIAPGEYTTWTSFTMTELFKEINNKTSSIEIVRKIRPHFDKCIEFKIEDGQYDDLLANVARNLYEIDIQRIKSLIGPRRKKKLKHWKREDFGKLLELLKTFELCYGLSKNDPFFLIEYNKILTEDNRWLMKSLMDGKLINKPTPLYFNADRKYNTLTSRIQESNSKYIPPHVDRERFEIRKKEFFKIESITKTAG